MMPSMQIAIASLIVISSLLQVSGSGRGRNAAVRFFRTGSDRRSSSTSPGLGLHSPVQFGFSPSFMDSIRASPLILSEPPSFSALAPRSSDHQYMKALLEEAEAEFVDRDSGLVPPYVGGGSGERVDMCPKGALLLREPLSQTASGRVFNAVVMTVGASGMGMKKRRVSEDDEVSGVVDAMDTNRAEWIVKYTSDCLDRLEGVVDPRHPLAEEAKFLFALKSSGLVPETIYLSPASPLSVPTLQEAPARIMSQVLMAKYPECYAARAEVRFMVQAKAGETVADYLLAVQNKHGCDESPTYLKTVIDVGIKIVRVLERLHTMGIVHGDIHGGNILLRSPVADLAGLESKDVDLVLIDFGYASYFPDFIGSPAKVAAEKPSAFANPDMLSHWQLDGYRVGRRDDLYRAMEFLARLLAMGSIEAGVDSIVQANLATHGAAAKGTPKHTETVRRVAKWYKGEAHLFRESVPLGSKMCGSMGVTSSVLSNVQSRLELILDAHVRSLSMPDLTPQYDRILKLLNETISTIV